MASVFVQTNNFQTEFNKIFFEDLYVKPFFENSAIPLTENVKFASEKNSFLRKLENTDAFPLLIIKGSAGTGKSTFLFHLMHEYYKRTTRKYQHIDYQIENPDYLCRVEEDYIPLNVPNVTNGLIVFEFLVFCKIIDIITELLDSKIHQSRKRRESFVKNYEMFSKSNSKVSKSQREILAWIGLFANEVNDEDREDLRYIISTEINKIRTQDVKKTIINLLQLTTMVIFCTFDHVKKRKDYCFLSFDGIEYYIRSDSISSCLSSKDIIEIVASIDAFKRNIIGQNSIFKETNEKFNNWFKILITLRDTTERFLPDSIVNTNDPNRPYIDVTKWYKFDDILNKKLLYFNEHKEFDNELIKLVNIIINDKDSLISGNSIMEMLEKMYSFNKRNLINSLFSVLDDFKINYSREVNLTKFTNFWEENINDTKINRFIFRHAVIRLILNQVNDIKIEDDSGFGLIHQLYFFDIDKDHKHIANKYARKIILFLMEKLYKGNTIKDQYISFAELIRGVFDEVILNNSWIDTSGTGKSNDVTKKFTHVLFLMGNHKLIDSYWHPLIILKHNGKTFDEGLEKIELEKILRNCYNNPEANINSGVTLTYSGIFLAEFQTEFEFFASRILNDSYKNTGLPLCLSNNPTYICDTLKLVYVDTVKCIRACIEKEYAEFKNDYSKIYEKEGFLYFDYKTCKKQTHPFRLINSQLNYLNEYMNFIEFDEKRHHSLVVFNDQARKIVKENVMYYRSLYLSLRTQLRDGHGGDKDERLVQGEPHPVHFNLAADTDGKPFLKDLSNRPYGYEPLK